MFGIKTGLPATIRRPIWLRFNAVPQILVIGPNFVLFIQISYRKSGR